MEQLEFVKMAKNQGVTHAPTILSFTEYLEEVRKKPTLHVRNAAQYFADVFSFFGTQSTIQHGIERTRFTLFDQAFDNHVGKVMGQEIVQTHIWRLLQNFVRVGQVDKLIFLHGPNGSAKTTIIRAIARAAELYSTRDEGALYRFNWIFPNKTIEKGSLGFAHSDRREFHSYAHLSAQEIEARIPCENKDHPLLLLPQPMRAQFFEQAISASETTSSAVHIADVLKKGELSQKNHKIFNALLASYQGKIEEVWRHVQVERFYLSKRYRTGLATVEPQLHVDAHAHPLTRDLSVASLPVSIQYQNLFETGGPLVDANRGLIEYSDLLKRPLDSWKYLLVTTEHAEASLDALSLYLDTVMVATSNELHLSSFREYPDWQSFKARIELIRVPYLLHVSDEVAIYYNQIPKALAGLHIAPHALELAALFAVLTRIEPPKYEMHNEPLRNILLSLNPFEKAMLYNSGEIPSRLSQAEAKLLRNAIATLYHEYDGDKDYEGRYGASPREIRVLLLSASQDKRFDHLSPLAVLHALQELIKEKSSYEFLRREPARNFHDPLFCLQAVKDYFDQKVFEDCRTACGLIEKDSHIDLFKRYIKNVSAWIKNEKVHDPLTNKAINPDNILMRDIERVLAPTHESPEDFRHSITQQIAAFKLEHPDGDMDYEKIFSSYLYRLKEGYFKKQGKAITNILNAYIKMVSSDYQQLAEKDREIAIIFQKNLSALGYNESSAKQAALYMINHNIT